MKAVLKRFGLVLAIVGLLVAGPLCYGLTYTGLRMYKRATRPPVGTITTPLDADVVQGLCAKLALPEGDQRCRAGAVVYAPDFALDIAHSLSPGVTTYEEVEQLYGGYRYRCEDPVYVRSLDVTLLRCWYDLRGDRMFPFALSFTDDGKLYRIMARPYDD